MTGVFETDIEIDYSGVGHCWKVIPRDEIPSDVLEEIEGEMIDGGMDVCRDFLACDGMHYRWNRLED